MQISNTNLIASFTELHKFLIRKDSHFPEILCDFIVDQFQLQAAALYKLLPDEKMLLIAKSRNSKKSLINGYSYQCSKCSIHKPASQHGTVFTDAKCEIQITDFMIYEACVILFDNPTEKFILKVAQKTPFTQLEKESLEIIANLSILFLNDWNSATSGGSPSASFTKLFLDLANDLRTPSNSILGFVSLLFDKNLSSTQIEYISALKENAQKLMFLINELIDLAKLESGAATESFGPLDLSSALKEIVAEITDKSLNKSNTINFVSNNQPGSLNTDIHKVKYILTNMISLLNENVDKGKISVEAIFGKNSVRVIVSEKSAQLTPHLIASFNQPVEAEIHSSKSKGLSPISIPLMKKYTSLIGGSLQMKSTREEGSSITFELTTEFISPIESQIASLPKVTSTHNRILVIEDDYATSKLLNNYLNKWNYVPTVVNSGEKALKLLESDDFLAIITDVVLPDINGLELLQRIRKTARSKNTPIIVCSVEAEKQKAFLMGTVEYFVKPIKYKDLVEVLTSYKLKKNCNILCVDDDIPTLSMVKEAIESVGFNAVATHRSGQVMRLIENIDLDLAIVDLDMPEINGFELIKLIKSNPKFQNLPIIIYTGKENFEEDLKSLDGLFTELLSKRSTNMEDLASVINGMLHRYEEPTSPEEAAKEKGTVKILLVEDYKHSQIIVTRLLKKNNFNTVVVVENGAEAVEQVRKQKFDLILMDMQMPVMNGFEATEKIRTFPEYKDTPIIALTAFAMKGDKEKCLNAGATDYIPKPIDSQEFIEKVNFYTSGK